MKKLLLSIFAMLLCMYSYAQNLPKIIPPSPEASSLLKFVESPITLASGIPNINIPIYTVKNKSVTVPVNLSYHAGGIKVEEQASRVGLGWSLNAGGLVSRTVQGLPDDHPLGYLYTSTEVASFANIPTTNTSVWMPILQGILNNTKDVESDIYSFNFGSYTGRFVYNQTTNSFFQTPFSNIKITPIKLSNKIIAWEFRTPDGYKYYFGKSKDSQRTGVDTNMNNNSYSYKSGGGFSIGGAETPSYISTWYLLDIVSPSNNIISFKYKSNPLNESFLNRIQEVDYYNDCTFGKEVAFVESKISKAYLEEIYWENGKVVFEESTSTRLDEENSKALKKIKVLDKSNNPVIVYELDHNYFVSDNNTVRYANFKNPTIRRHRLKLLSVKRTTNNQEETPYIFKYNSIKLPSKFSQAQDYWGYYNGMLNNTSLIADYEDTTLGLSFNGADRSVSESYARAAILEKITYPTGGTIEYLYESNRVTKVEGTNPNYPLRNGLINKSKLFYKHSQFAYTGNNFPNLNPAYETSFSISGSVYGKIKVNTSVTGCNNNNPLSNHDCDFRLKIIGVTNSNFQLYINSSISYLNLPEGEYKIQVYEEGDGVDLNPNEVDFNLNMTWKEEQNPSELLVGGLRVKRIISKDSDNAILLDKSFKYNQFGTQTSSGYIISHPIFINKDFKMNFCDPIKVGYKFFSYSQAPAVNVYGNVIGYKNVTEHLLNNSKSEYTFWGIGARAHNSSSVGSMAILKPDVYSNWERGNLIKKEAFKKEGNSYIKVEGIENIYEKLGSTYINNIGLKTNFEPTPDPTISVKFAFYSAVSEWFRLKSTIATDYFDTGNIIKNTNYTYNNNPLLASEVTVTDSSGDVLKTKTYYPDDVTNISALGADNLTTSEKNVIDRMKTDILHMQGTPVQTESYKNNILLNRQRTIFIEPSVGFVSPQKIQSSKGLGVLEDRLVFHGYYANGNVKEVSKQDGTHIVYIWGYNESQPIAKIENAIFNDIPSSVYTSILNASNLDSNTSTENTLRVELSKLRNASYCPNLSKSQITTYTYDPLIGVTSITDARGKTMYYQYDSFNRLEYVKDQDGKILKKNEYHYKN